MLAEDKGQKRRCPQGLGPWNFFGSGLTGIKNLVVMSRRVAKM